MLVPDYKKFELDMKEYFEYKKQISDGVIIKEVWNRCADKYQSFMILLEMNKTLIHYGYHRGNYGPDVKENHEQYMCNLFKIKRKAMIKRIKRCNKKFMKKYLDEFKDAVSVDIGKLKAGVKLEINYKCQSLYDMCSKVLNLNIPAIFEVMFLNNILNLSNCKPSDYNEDAGYLKGAVGDLYKIIFDRGWSMEIETVAKELSYFD